MGSSPVYPPLALTALERSPTRAGPHQHLGIIGDGNVSERSHTHRIGAYVTLNHFPQAFWMHIACAGPMLAT